MIYYTPRFDDHCATALFLNGTGTVRMLRSTGTRTRERGHFLSQGKVALLSTRAAYIDMSKDGDDANELEKRIDPQDKMSKTYVEFEEKYADVAQSVWVKADVQQMMTSADSEKPTDPEKRIDKATNIAFTKEKFMQFYPADGEAKWAEAAPAKRERQSDQVDEGMCTYPVSHQYMAHNLRPFFRNTGSSAKKSKLNPGTNGTDEYGFEWTVDDDGVLKTKAQNKDELVTYAPSNCKFCSGKKPYPRWDCSGPCVNGKPSQKPSEKPTVSTPKGRLTRAANTPAVVKMMQALDTYLSAVDTTLTQLIEEDKALKKVIKNCIKEMQDKEHVKLDKPDATDVVDGCSDEEK
jgi:hypothetical protein